MNPQNERQLRFPHHRESRTRRHHRHHDDYWQPHSHCRHHSRTRRHRSLDHSRIQVPAIVPSTTGKSALWKEICLHFSTPYQGQALSAVQEVLRDNEAAVHRAPEGYYSKCIPMLQASGMGKTRLCDELSKQVFTIGFTLRPEQESGYPRGDLEILHFLRGQHVDISAAIISLLASCLKNVNNWLATQKAEKAAPGDLARKWYELMKPIQTEESMKDNRSPERKAFCNRVLLNARQIYDNIWKDTEWHSKAHDQKIDSEISKELLLKPAAELLETLAIAHKDNSSALCLWVFDEVANMNAEYLTTLRRTILIFQKLPMWTFLLSTNSAIGRLITAQHDDPSARVRSLQLNRFLPFLALPVDIEYNRRLSDPSLRTIELYKPMNQFATVDHMTCFGRPLWGSYISADVKEIQEFVEYKLLGARPIARLSSEQNIWVRQVFALIAARICLDPAMNSKEAVDLANEAVNTHLRLVVGWEEDHRMIETVSPAEPLVADAAANVLMRKDEQGKYTWVRVIKAVVVKLLSGGLISKGLKGEIFARLICTLSADFAREARRMNVVGEEFPFSQPIRLKDFLINMFGKDIIHRLQEVSGRRSQYDSRLRQQTTVPDFETCLGEAYINFNHFTFTTQSLPPNDPNVMQTMVAQLLRRHEALQLCENQPHWDLLIPVYLGSLNEAFDNVKTTVIVIQVKNRLRKTTPITRARDFRTHFSAHQKPMMYILLDLRVDFELSVHTVPGTNVFCITARGAMMDTFPCMVCKRGFSIPTKSDTVLDSSDSEADDKADCSQASSKKGI